MSGAELVALVCCDLGAIVRGRSVLQSELDSHLAAGVGWVPANQSLTPLGPVAEPNPFGSTGDLRLLPDPATHVRVGPEFGPATGATVGPELGPANGVRVGPELGPATGGQGLGGCDPGVAAQSALEFMLCDIVETDGRPWAGCPRSFLRETLATVEREIGAHVQASFEHEFQLQAPLGAGSEAQRRFGGPPGSGSEAQSGSRTGVARTLPFSLDAMRRAEPFAADLMGALVEAGVQPERFFAEYAADQFEVPVDVADGLASADRAVIFREVVREIARRHRLRASFAPLLDVDDAGNGVHIHLNLLDGAGTPLLYDAGQPGCLSELGGRFAAGVLRHAPALSALTAPSPVSGVRLQPHRWSAGAVCLAQQDREALLRITPIVPLGGGDPARQLHLEYRGADATANPHLALACLLLAGLDGIREGLPVPPLLDCDPAELDAQEADAFGVGALPASLEEGLHALDRDERARAWLDPLMYDAYTSVKSAEVRAAADWDLAERCRRYAEIY